MQTGEIKQLLLSCDDKQKTLWAHANKVREKNIGKKAYFRGIIEFSNYCEKNCNYCGIRSGNTKVHRYTMSISEIEECLDFIAQVRYGSVVLQSGELTSKKSKKFLLQIVQLIHKKYPEFGVTLSCGELDFDILKLLREAGASRYLLRIETSDPEFYAQIHPANHSFPYRVETLKNLKKLGYQVGCGNMVGVPGQTLEHLISDLKFFQEMDFDMFGLGPYVIHEDTPLATPENVKWWHEHKNEIYQRTLNFIALLRILMPDSNIAAATALDVFSPAGRVDALRVGANVIMPVVTPQKYRGDYLLYQGKPCIDEDAMKCSACIQAKVRNAGLVPTLGVQGNSRHYEKRITNQEL